MDFWSNLDRLFLLRVPACLGRGIKAGGYHFAGEAKRSVRTNPLMTILDKLTLARMSPGKKTGGKCEKLVVH